MMHLQLGSRISAAPVNPPTWPLLQGGLGGWPYTASGCTATSMIINASANAVNNEVFTLVTGVIASTTYTPSSVVTCTIAPGANSCSWNGNEAIPANRIFAITQTTVGTPNWTVAGTLKCQ
jgi:hypothetical protein